MIGNMRTAALIDRHASLEWLCLPRFDSEACCAALIGEQRNGYWQIRPVGEIRSQSRCYRGETLVLETLFETLAGSVAIIDFMPLSRESDTIVDVVRIVEGRSGRVEMQSRAVFRFDYGHVHPWVHCRREGVSAIAGPAGLRLDSPIEMRDRHNDIEADFTIEAGERVPFVLTWYHAYSAAPERLDACQSLDETERWWLEWSERCQIDETFREPVVRSLITLKALTHVDTGGIVAAPTTSLPEEIGGELNWDYRFTWLRDVTFTLYALLSSGYREEAKAWREWLLRVAGGDPRMLQPMYGVGGERRLDEQEIVWLTGFNGCRPVRVGNEAYLQRQNDIYGQVMDGLHLSRLEHMEPDEDMWNVQRRLIAYLEDHWQEKDAGLWELRGPEQHYTYSKIMAWVAVDRVIKDAESYRLEGDLPRWRALRARIHEEVCQRAFNRERNAFVMHYDTDSLDAVLLLIPQMGFLPIEDPRVVGTIEAIQAELVHDGFVYRFLDEKKRENLTDGEGAFLLCCFWLVDALLLLGRKEEARELFDKLLAVRNDLGLLAEEYHPVHECQLGNFPQAFSHVGLVNSAHNLSRHEMGPAKEHSKEEGRGR
ncbi:glycoside hydrolase family 15 protein [Halomonas sp. PA5]|nr:glycoside hydrolase family 15 protein [Halomonas sp. PA5]